MYIRNAVRDVLKNGARKLILNVKYVKDMDDNAVEQIELSAQTAENRGGKLVLSGLPGKIKDPRIVNKLSLSGVDTYSDDKAALVHL